nr:uncharacterized protein LOC111838128 isoform X1 [Paramormyrops kingsleyae]
MGALVRLVGLLALSWTWTLPPGCAVGTCDGFRHLANGRTFFRYGGLYVTFTCNPGFKLHGHRTSSCLSGRWIRDPPVCVASGCPDPGQPQHGSSIVTQDGSFAAFTCHGGYRLYGPQLLYCQGGVWNTTRPVCKESDIMSSDKHKYLDLLGLGIEHNANLPLSTKDLSAFWYNNVANTPLKDALPKTGLQDKELLRNSHPKPIVEEHVLKEIGNRIPPERDHPKKHWSSQTSEAGVEYEDTYKEPADYGAFVTKPEELLASSASPTPETNFLTASYPESKSSSTSPVAGIHEDMAPQTEGIPAHTVGPNLLVARRPDPEAPNAETVPLNAGPPAPSETSMPGAESYRELTVESNLELYDSSTGSELQDQNFTPEVSTFLATHYLETSKTWATPASIIQAGFLGFSQANPPLRQASNLQTHVTFLTASMGDISTSQSVPESRATSMDAASSGLGKHISQYFMKKKSTEMDGDSEELRSGSAIGFVKSPSEISTSVNTKEGKMSGQPGVNSAMSPDPAMTLAPTDSLFKDSSDLHSLISLKPTIYKEDWGESSRSNVSARLREDDAWQGILLARTQEGLTLPGEVTPEPSGAPDLGTGWPMSEPAVVTNRMPPETGTFPPNPVSVTGTQEDSATGSLVESTSSPVGWLRTVTLQTSRAGQEDNASSALGEIPLPVTVNASPGPMTGSPHVLKVAGQLWVRRRRPTCPYPPLPAHGTFYFRTVANPTPQQYKHFVQYACYPGYTLANGDVYSYCLQGGKWSGVTPLCIEEIPCSISNGGCSQFCDIDLQNQARCRCRPGFQLLEDARTCRDKDECAEETHSCQQICINTFGSFECHCGPGYLLSSDGRTCSVKP